MESLSSILSPYGEAFLRLFYPSLCASCEQLLTLEERGLCGLCKNQLQKLRLFPSEERIRIHLSWADEGWALFRYEGLVKEMIHKIKFTGRRDLLHLFSEDFVGFTRRRELTGYDCVIPIPLDFRRRMEREFNQSGLLAEKICKILGMRFEPLGLAKRRSTPAQSLLGREARRFNLDQAFSVPQAGRVKGRSPLLVDDIFTTGATIEEAAKTLKDAGAVRVGYLALARTFAA